MLYAHCGMSMICIAKIFKIIDVAVLKWIRAFSDAIFMPTQAAKVIQIDEICTFVTDKWTCFFRLLPEDRHFFGHWVAVMMPASKSLFKKSITENAPLQPTSGPVSLG